MDILSYTENALYNVLTGSFIDNNITCNLNKGIDNEVKEAPLCIVSSIESSEEAPGLPVYHIKTKIEVIQVANDTSISGSISDDLNEKILSSILNDNLINNLNKYPNYYVYNVMIDNQSNDTKDDCWINTTTLDIVGCCKQ